VIVVKYNALRRVFGEKISDVAIVFNKICDRSFARRAGGVKLIFSCSGAESGVLTADLESA